MNPTNQVSTESLVVPVLPAAGRLSLPSTPPAVPCQTWDRPTVMAAATSGSTAWLHFVFVTGSALPVRSCTDFTATGEQYRPAFAKPAYAAAMASGVTVFE